MKNKIAMWCMLFALLVALVPPSSARANTTETTADDVKYTDIEDFMHSAGYTDFVKSEDSMYIAIDNGSYYFVYEYGGINSYEPFVGYDATSGITYVFCNADWGKYTFTNYKYYNTKNASTYGEYGCLETKTSPSWLISTQYVYYQGSKRMYTYIVKNIDSIIYSDLDIYEVVNESTSTASYWKKYDTLVYESNVEGCYSFPVWSEEAGLNCLSSTNESSSKIPYSYNGYYHIVRKTSAGKWLLTTIGNSLGQKDVQVRFTEDNGALMLYNSYSGEDVNGYMVNVRQYEYDTDGWKVRTYETFDARDYENGIIELGAGTGVDSTRVLAYTNTDIYSYNSYAIAQSASTEYIEVGGTTDTGGGSDSGDSETEEPTVTPVPTTAPSGGDTSDGSGSGSEGGGTGGGTRPEGGTSSIIDWSEIKLSDIPQAIEDFKDTLLAFGDLIGSVPHIVGAVFSFVPTWCLTLIGLFIGLLGVLIVVKFVRG